MSPTQPISVKNLQAYGCQMCETSRYFLCRYCHDLTYTSRQETGWYAALRRCQRIRQKLGGSVNMTEPFPNKPKGMHHRTYRRLFLEYKQAHEEFTSANDEYARRLIADLERG